MLPIKLSVRNFLSYGPDAQVLDFSQLTVACLSGDNGVGKSSLLEAITWALWGWARQAGDNDLVHIGQTEMEVELEFAMEDRVYRVLRRREKKKKGGTTSVELQGWDGEWRAMNPSEASGSWKSLTEPTVRETQEKIHHLLGISYETFINSAFIRQGHANEFTLKRPAERKAILGEILGLHRYDQWEIRAKDKVRAIELSIQALLMSQEQSMIELAGYEQLITDESQKRQDLITAETALKDLLVDLERLQKDMGVLEASKQRLTHLEEQRLRMGQDLLMLKKKLDTLAEERTRNLGVLSRQKDIEAGHRRMKEVDEQLKFEEGKFKKHVQIKEQEELLGRKMQEVLFGIESQIQMLTGQKELLKEELKQATKAKLELQTMEQDLEARDALKETVAELNRKIKAVLTKISSLESENKLMSEQGSELKDRRILLLSPAKVGSASGGKSCPLCTQALDKNHLQKVLDEMDEDIEKKRETYRENAVNLKRLQEEQMELESGLSKAELQLMNSESLLEQVATLKKFLKDLTRKKTVVGELQEQLEKLEAQKKESSAITPLLSEQQKLHAEKLLIHYDERLHHTLLEERERVSAFGALYQQLTIALEQEKNFQAVQKDVEEQSRQLEEQLMHLEREWNTANDATRGFDHAVLEWRQKGEEATTLRESVQELRSNVAVLKSRLEALERKQQLLKAQQAQVLDLQKEETLFEELAVAFGKKGVQAMLIESAIPEIEQQANHLLERMTMNQMHVKFEAQREKLTGDGLIETLEIKVADNWGTRDYELFSGGEAFRIDFAIRIALSKLLAARAGTHLKLLIIDEGFGSQDALGRERLVESINSIHADFEKILVITHIQELKDMFDQKIEIEKTETGSKIRLVV